ncbi:short chain dehydrogenase family protein [Mycobacterium ulcerans str. Harvey]|uniref:Short chain dehydrogenase family protein n=1 Tax=Mycobacterium ulcerans str. Harvey TaxID=1299332 RepID=A0ABN0QP77_MYCUL|nr:short chain dehydrogenase family protein [Mycobacterium ulcerans str. Harvey]
MAFAAARCGANVVIASRNLDNCVATATEIESETGRSALAYQVHVGRWDQLDGLVAASYERFGKIDTLINNAGMSPLYDKLSDVTEKLFDAVLNLNLKGPFRLSALVGERMVAADGGSIINVSSAGSLRPSADIIPMPRQRPAQRDDRGPGAGIRTDGARQHIDGRAVSDRCQQGLEPRCGHAESIRPPSLRRAGNPPEIVGAALFLASDASSFTTGSILRADGGIP